MTNPNDEPTPRQPLLPVVAEDIKHSVLAEFGERQNLILETYWRMVSEQPALTNQMASYIQNVGRDDTEKIHMMETMVFTYRMLEAQAESDQLNEQVNGPTPESRPE